MQKRTNGRCEANWAAAPMLHNTSGLHGQRARAADRARARALVMRASATASRPRKKMSVCSSTLARPAICALGLR